MHTIRDVAEKAQVSIATVSRILNNDTTYKITQETKERVWRAVTELNYKARPKTRKKTTAEEGAFHRIGCVMNLRSSKYTDPYYLSLLSGIELHMQQHGGEVSFVKTRQELETTDSLQRLMSDPVDGLVLMYPVGKRIFDYLYERIPFIVGVDTGYPEIDNIEYDHLHVASMGVTALYERGYRDIGFIGGTDGVTSLESSKRYQGFLQAMRRYQLPVKAEWIQDCGWDDAVCMQQVESMFRTTGLPRAFFVGSDLMAMATLRTLYNLGIRVPDEVAVMGLSNLEMSKYSNPPLSTIDIPSEEMGRTAAKTLLERIAGDMSMKKRIILPSKYVLRDSI